MGVLWEGLTYETLAKTSCLHPVLTLRIPVMCRAHASLREMLTRELPAKTLQSSVCLSLQSLSLSHTQPLQINPTLNIRYKRLNIIIIKFDTELKLTKHIVVNYNYTVRFFFIGFSIKLVKNRAWNEESVQFCNWLDKRVPAKMAREKHMLEAKESC